MIGGGERSNATARSAVGLGNIEAKDIQEKTNQLYNEFVADLKKGQQTFDRISSNVTFNQGKLSHSVLFYNT